MQYMGLGISSSITLLDDYNHQESVDHHTDT